MSKPKTTHTITIPLPGGGGRRRKAVGSKTAAKKSKKPSPQASHSEGGAPDGATKTLTLVTVSAAELGSIVIDEGFRELVPAIRDDERKQLEESVVAAGGVRDPLTVWLQGEQRVLLDGHNRLAICKRHGLPVTCHNVQFADRAEAEDWIDRNQLGRRNLSQEHYDLLLGRRYERAKKSPGAQVGNNNAAADKAEKVTASKTAERLAKEHGVSEKTVRNAGKFQKAAETLGIEKEIASGDVKASRKAVVAAAAGLPDRPTATDIEKARAAVKAAPKRRRKGESGGKSATTDGGDAPPSAAGSKSSGNAPADELRSAVTKRWENMRVWDKHWGAADMKDVRQMFIEVIRAEQRRFDR